MGCMYVRTLYINLCMLHFDEIFFMQKQTITLVVNGNFTAGIIYETFLVLKTC